MWSPTMDFAYGFATGISFFLLVEIVRCVRVACQEKKSLAVVPPLYVPSAPIMSPRYEPCQPPPVYKN